MENLKRLQCLCDAVNSRYQRGLNDDDQVRNMFKFEKSIKDAQVIIGYEDYQALSTEEIKAKIAGGAEEYTPGYYKLSVNGRHYNTKSPN